MNITNEQPTAPKVRTMPEYAEWTHNGLTHFLGGLEEGNIEAYKRVISDNDDNKVMALSQVMNIERVLVTQLSESWEVTTDVASKIMYAFNLYKVEKSEASRALWEGELRKSCKKTNLGEELADMLISM